MRAMPEERPDLATTIQVKVVERSFGAITGPYQTKPGAGGLTARITAPYSLKINWAIQGGEIEGRRDGRRVLFRSGHGSEVLLICELTNEAGDTFTTYHRVRLEPAGTP